MKGTQKAKSGKRQKNAALKRSEESSKCSDDGSDQAVCDPILSVDIDESRLCSEFDAHISTESVTPEEGIQSARDMYIDVVKYENKIQKRTQYLLERKDYLTKEIYEFQIRYQKDLDAIEKSKAQSDRLYILSDELSKQKEECIAKGNFRLREQRVLRQEKSESFIKQIKVVSSELEDHSVIYSKHAKENETLKENLRKCLDSYHNQETSFDTKLASHTAKLEQLHTRQKEVILSLAKEKEYGVKLEEQISTLSSGESTLRAQLAVHADRFEQFQESLSLSNDTFSSFKVRMEKLTSDIRLLEKENAALNLKKNKCQSSITDLKDDISLVNCDIDLLQKQVDKLNGLVKILNNESQLKQEEIDARNAAKNV